MERVVLIIGASSGIGLSCAQRFVNAGDKVVNMSRRDCPIPEVRNIRLDVTDENSVIDAWNYFTAEFSHLDIFIYSAGFSMASPVEYASEQDYRYLFEVNFFGYLNFLKKSIPYLKESGGTACVVGSTGGVAPIPYDCFYSASKAALNMLTAALWHELKPLGITAICVMPGGTKTHFTFKRKEYKPEDVGEYGEALTKAAQALAEIEQNGMEAESVAKTIYRKCTRRPCAPVYASGIANKLSAFLIRLIPQRLVYLIVKKQFDLDRE